MNLAAVGLILSMMGAAPKNPGVLLITVDTLRADRLQCYGYDRPTSPFWNKLAAESVLFEQAFSQSSFTPPSHASLMTSLYVREHGVKTWNPLRNKHKTLAEVLRRANFRTHAVNSLNLLTLQNLGQGFEDGDEECRNADEVNEKALAWLETVKDERYFLWLHYYDVHWPYARQPGYEAMFRRSDEVAVEIGRAPEHYNLPPEKVQELGFGEREFQYLTDRYDGGIAYLDSALKALSERLQAMGLWDRTLLVLTSDHGESFAERRIMFFAHDPFLHDEVTRLPLVVRFPGGEFAGTRVQSMIESIDLAPTVLDYLNVSIPDTYRGHSLLPLLRGQGEGRREVFSECWGKRILKSIRTERWKLIWSLLEKEVVLYDMLADPAETVDVAAQHPEVTADLRKRLEEWAGSESEQLEKLPELDEKTLRQLRALGYVGGSDAKEIGE